MVAPTSGQALAMATLNVFHLQHMKRPNPLYEDNLTNPEEEEEEEVEHSVASQEIGHTTPIIELTIMALAIACRGYIIWSQLAYKIVGGQHAQVQEMHPKQGEIQSMGAKSQGVIKGISCLDKEKMKTRRNLGAHLYK